MQTLLNGSLQDYLCSSIYTRSYTSLDAGALKMFLLLENPSDSESEVMCSYAEIIRDVQNF